MTSPGVTRIFKPYSREMAEIRDAFIAKNKITNRLTAKRLPLSTIAKECLATNASVSIALGTNRAEDCKSCSLCQICQRKHHTSICNSVSNQLMTATSLQRSSVIYPVVLVELMGVKCRVVRHRHRKFVCFSSVT